MKLGVYIGSFNPPQKGHLKIVNYLIQNYVDKVIIIPTGNYWNKTNLLDIDKRISMLKIFESDNVIIDDKNNDIEYTYLLLEKLKLEFPCDELYLVLGADNIINFDKWRNYQDLLNYNFIIINRENIDIKYYLNKLSKSDKYIITDNLPLINISSTMVRAAIKNGEFCKLNNMLDERVLKYILENNLYVE